MHIALHGELGDTPVTVLPSRPEHFERGQTGEWSQNSPNAAFNSSRHIQAMCVVLSFAGHVPSIDLETVQITALLSHCFALSGRFCSLLLTPPPCPVLGWPDCFRINLPHVGTLRALTIGHNNKGPGPEWHLEMVEVTVIS